ncbi:hypothetical protein COT48_03285 [Candidatus Woesearchaeota archaeon CG08_land_8_20_14_0_20_47_9]|nr:MAG: hypothetical protein COT48_03285 [Candidatus Woesearchaeota archaeon CG08_land_8_20_14_0_20_47_9]HII30348.1 hypothetical protein [Candidatus Woesearchaeota archaeon]
MQMRKETKLAISTAKKAGLMLKKHFGRYYVVKHKNKHDILLDVDVQADRLIRKELSKSGLPMITEESQHKSKAGSFWVVDPLDGSINFGNRIKDFAVSIALVEEGLITTGVIFIPEADELYHAEQERGAFMNNLKMHVSKKTRLSEAILSMTLSSVKHRREKELEIMRCIGERVINIRSNGSSAVSCSMLARGAFDCYLTVEPHFWDYAAGSLLIREAGGLVTDFEGREYCEDSRSLVIGNSSLHKQLRGMIKGLQVF